MQTHKAYHFFTLVVAVVLSFSSFAQTPQMSSFEPANPNSPTIEQKHPYYVNSQLEAEHHKLSGLNLMDGNNAQTIHQQNNIRARQAMGYTPPAIPPSDPVLLNQFIVNQYQRASANNMGTHISKQRHFVEVMNELHETDQKNTVSITNTQVPASYQKAFSTINNMLTGKSKPSFIEAVYAAETAFGNPYLSYHEYKAIIQQSADFIKQWLRQQNAPLTSDNLHYALQQFMGGKMSITVFTDDKKATKTITHNPFKYDYVDYDGKADYRNYFATKCLATGTGQCSSMPDVHLLLCEALGIKGYKTFAPFHSYVKYKTSKGTIENYEPTSHWNLPDKWYQEHLGVTPKAKASHIYLDTLNKKQCIANALVDLAISYMIHHTNPDTAFIQKCLTTSHKYFPKGNNLYGYLAKSSLLHRQLHQALKRHGVKDLAEVNNYPDTSRLYKCLKENEEYLTGMGYEEMPQELYEEMLQHQKNKVNSPDAKTKKSLFKAN